MKNTRKIEVGQIRQVLDNPDEKYVILSIGAHIVVKLLTGTFKNEIQVWDRGYVEFDIVVM